MISAEDERKRSNLRALKEKEEGVEEAFSQYRRMIEQELEEAIGFVEVGRHWQWRMGTLVSNCGIVVLVVLLAAACCCCCHSTDAKDARWRRLARERADTCHLEGHAA